ncbi:MAG: class I SAM-dependent methyltransferase family protein [Candidatus Lokiarchaeota archaeon]|nr:class I SAM-dependent methyltransferase family protein [Candidatus Lokiarchaeota archaeon]
MRFKRVLQEHLKFILEKEELEILPRGFQSIGSIMILKLDKRLLEKKILIGEACFKIYPYIKSIYLNLGIIKGQMRQPERIEFLMGVDQPIIIHKEHEVKYKLDITKIMFSKGNLKERKFLTTFVKPGEILVDMFAGIGYFSLPIAKHTKVAKIYSIELNPVSFHYLKENIILNHLENKIIPINGDCKVEVRKLSEAGIKADRIVMGVFPAPIEYIEDALTLTKEEGTTIHFEGVVDKYNYVDLFNTFSTIANNNGYLSNLTSERFVKSYGPNLAHVVLDIFVVKNKNHRSINFDI